MTEKTKKTETPVIGIEELQTLLAIGDGKGAIVEMKRGEVPEFLATMKKVTGFANNDPASKFGADARLVKTVKEEIDEQPELLKTSHFKELEKEFEKLREKYPDKQPAEIVNAWKDGKEYVKLVKEFNEEMNNYYKEKIQFRFRSHLKPEDFRAGAIADTDVAALLADFWKEELK